MFYKDERLAIFIDGPNLFGTAKNLGLDVDYKRLLAHFANSGRLIRASYYTAVNEHEEFQPLRPLVDWMQYNGWNTVTKPTREYASDDGPRKIKGNMNVELTVDAIALAPHIDHVVLFTGDQNFLPLIRHLQTTGIRVSVVSSIRTNPQIVADDLRRQADAFIELDSLRDSIGRPQNVASAA